MTMLLIFAALASLFPANARIVETREVRKDRVIVLWMIAPTEDPGVEDSCFEKLQLHGPHFHGPTRVSLVDTSAPHIINTIAIDNPDSGEDSFDIPKKRMLSLRDYNGDGRALEFALFYATTCSDLFTTLIGYSIRRDDLIQYAVHTKYDKDEFITVWPEHLFDIKPVRSGLWRYRLVFPPGPPDVPFEHWTVRYVPEREEFEAVCVTSMKR